MYGGSRLRGPGNEGAQVGREPAAALLAWRFHRSRVLAAVLALAVVEWLLRLDPGPTAQLARTAAESIA